MEALIGTCTQILPPAIGLLEMLSKRERGILARKLTVRENKIKIVMSKNNSTKTEPTALEKLQDLLRTLFQFELSDLDFGIYRLFRLKQDELRAFIDKQLPETVD